LKLLTIPLRESDDVTLARSRCFIACKMLHLAQLATGRIVLTVSEVSRLATKLDGQSKIEIDLVLDNHPQQILIVFNLPLKTWHELQTFVATSSIVSDNMRHSLLSILPSAEYKENKGLYLFFRWQLKKDIEKKQLEKIRDQLFSGLGLTETELARLQNYNLSDLLNQVRSQQELLKKQKQELTVALNKIEKDLDAARDAQMSLLPKELVGVPQVKFAARFYPSQFVSGDIYNIFRLDETIIGLYHIDVSGHGVPASLFSVSLSQLLNTNISSRNLLKIPIPEPPYYLINPPDRVISMLEAENTYEKYSIYFTMIYMLIDIKNREIKYTRAGHNPPVIIRHNGNVEIPKMGGLPVGWGFERDDEVIGIAVQPGDKLFMYSDGINEATNEQKEMFGMERLVNILQKNREKDIDQILDLIIEQLQKFTNSDSFEDDVSIIGLAWQS